MATISISPRMRMGGWQSFGLADAIILSESCVTQAFSPEAVSIKGTFDALVWHTDSTVTQASIEKEFGELAAAWRSQTVWSSSLSQKITHPSYQRIIGLGPRVIPLIFTELIQDPDYWFWALQALTGANPVPEEHNGDLYRMTGDWVEWGRLHGYIP